MMKQSLFTAVESRKDDLLRMADYICDNPEVGLKEYKASALLSESVSYTHLTLPTTPYV